MALSEKKDPVKQAPAPVEKKKMFGLTVDTTSTPIKQKKEKKEKKPRKPKVKKDEEGDEAKSQKSSVSKASTTKRIGKGRR